jgi:hypothetical protein
MDESGNDAPLADEEGLRQRIERQILLGTWGRIHNLSVEVTDGEVVVRGSTQSFYIKQLVLQAVIDILGSTPPVAVKFNIQVGAGGPHKLQGGNDLWGVPSN